MMAGKIRLLEWSPLDYAKMDCPEFSARQLLVLGPKGIRSDVWLSGRLSGRGGHWYSGSDRSDSLAWLSCPNGQSPCCYPNGELQDLCEKGLPSTRTAVVEYFKAVSKTLDWAGAVFHAAKRIWVLQDGTELAPGLVHCGIIVPASLSAQLAEQRGQPQVQGQSAPLWG